MPQKNSFLGLALGQDTQLQWVARLLLLSTLVWAISLISAATANIFTSNFEEDLSGWDKQLCCSNSAQIVSFPTREGKHAVKVTLRKSDPKKRAELKLGTVPANSEQWYGFSVFLPKDYRKDPMHEIITQWHGKPDMGEDNVRPPLALYIKDNKFGVVNRWDSEFVTAKSGIPGQRWDLGAIPKGQWSDWVFHIKWSYKSDGLLEVWKNGKLVVRKTGSNSYNDKLGPYLKIGIYKPQWKSNSEGSTTTKRVIYYDAVRVGNASATYKDVVPKSCRNSLITSP